MVKTKRKTKTSTGTIKSVRRKDGSKKKTVSKHTKGFNKDSNIKSIKTKRTYGKTKVKRAVGRPSTSVVKSKVVKKYKDGGKKVTVSKRGDISNQPYSRKGEKGLITTKIRKNGKKVYSKKVRK